MPVVSEQAECVRKVTSWAFTKPYHKLDNPVFDRQKLLEDLGKVAPGVLSMLENIQKLDAADSSRHKHFIFTDVATSGKLVAAAFMAMGHEFAYDKEFILDKQTLAKSAYKNVALLTSKPIWDKGQPVKFRKELLSMFNERPSNIKGKYIRYIILDSGFKEGIDLYDVKYVHLLEPLVTAADEAQAIGRATRYCGQKGLHFVPNQGWPLHVYRYNANTSNKLKDESNSDTLFDLFMQLSGLDPQLLHLSHEMNSVVIDAAVDKHLTSALHVAHSLADTNLEAEEQGKNKQTMVPKPPSTDKGVYKLQQQVAERFGHHKWPPMKVVNECGIVDAASSLPDHAAPEQVKRPVAHAHPQIVNFTPSQGFIQEYFKPETPTRGMLIYHSVGTGKSCTAIATATAFQEARYTILWVTRHTLKADLWKNMYAQVCNLVIQGMVKRGELTRIPTSMAERMKHLDGTWVEPMSYKQFANLLSGRNKKLARELIARNGHDDPLRKTLLIIDEAHKLFAPDLKAAERVDPDELLAWIQNSYTISGNDSVRPFLMTGTPITDDAMSMVRLLNFLLPAEQAFPVSHMAFSKRYLDGHGHFTTRGHQEFQRTINGMVSYVNRGQDARQYAIPMIHDIYYNMSVNRKESLKENVKEIRESLKGFVSDRKQIIDERRDRALEDLVIRVDAMLQDCAKLKLKKEQSTCAKKARDELRIKKQEIKEAHKAQLSAIKESRDHLKTQIAETRMEMKKFQKKKLDQETDDKMKQERLDIKAFNANLTAMKSERHAELMEIAEERKMVKIEMDKLRKEIMVIKQNPSSEKAMDEAKQKMEKLKADVEKLRQQRNDVLARYEKPLENLQQKVKGLRKDIDAINIEKRPEDAQITQDVALKRCFRENDKDDR